MCYVGSHLRKQPYPLSAATAYIFENRTSLKFMPQKNKDDLSEQFFQKISVSAFGTQCILKKLQNTKILHLSHKFGRPVVDKGNVNTHVRLY